MAKKETAKRVPFNWPKLLTMWKAKKSYLEMAKALDSHYDSDGDDPTKSIRAKCSVAMNKGVMIDGKLVKFARRDKKNVGEPKKTAPKKARKGATKAAPKTKAVKKAIPKPTQKPSVEPTQVETKSEA